ncbi:single-stranded-DNA-specific exonuclease RecJ [Nitrospira sp. Nam74]
MLSKQWIVRHVDSREQMALASLLSISPMTASVLVARGVTTKEQADHWMSPHQGGTHDPLLIPDLEKAVDRLHRAVQTGERMCFYGDYDVDGMSATSLYVLFFRGLGAKVCWYIPHRIGEGYGLNVSAITQLRRDGVTLLVTSDCGTTALREVEVACRLGLDVIITDHHQGEEVLPPAFAIMNPYRKDSIYPFPGLCSAGLAYKVVRAYHAKYGAGQMALESLLDLVALATVADVVPLQDENRYFVRQGLDLISRGIRPGIKALKSVAGVERTCTAGTIAFRLAPRINAAGRLAHADLGVDLLTTESESKAHQIAGQLELLNRERQAIEEQTVVQALAAVNPDNLPAAVVVASRGWHLGVVGIVAARLVERYHRPAVVIAINEQGIGKGSARSIPGFDLYEALSECRHVLKGYGGHPAAAGLTIEESRLPEFVEQFQQVAGRWGERHNSDPLLQVDAEVKLTDVGPRVIRELDRLHPFGAGNPEPVFVVRNLAMLDVRVVGEGHLKLVVRQQGSTPVESIGFRLGELLAQRGLSRSAPIDLAFMPELNRWNGLDRIQLRIKDLRACRPS